MTHPAKQGIVAMLGIDGHNGRDVPIPPKRRHNAMNVFSSLRADEDIGPYQLLCPQLCDITKSFGREAAARLLRPRLPWTRLQGRMRRAGREQVQRSGQK